MILVRIDTTSRQPDALVESWTSLIWTERYYDPSDFTLVTADIEYTENLLQVDTWVSLLDSDEIMVVETHSVAEDDNGVRLLTITGRSLAVVLLENRAMVIGEDATAPDYYQFFTPGLYIVDIINRRIAGAVPPGLNPALADNPDDRIDGCYCIATSDFKTDAPTSPFPDTFSPGDVASFVFPMVKQNALGLRIARPGPDSNTLIFVVYVGYDRRRDADVFNPVYASSSVIFRFDLGDLMGYSYLNSNKDQKNVACVVSPLGYRVVYADETKFPPTGLDRRVLQVDASDLTDSGSLTDDEALRLRGLSELAKHNRVSLIDGTLAPTNRYVFRGPDTNYRYDLGDMISLLGKANVATDRRVTEFIRSQDKNGEKGYPTLTALDSET